MDEELAVGQTGQPESVKNGCSADLAVPNPEGSPASGQDFRSQGEPVAEQAPAAPREMPKNEPPKVVSEKKLVSNRMNSLCSTGPRTPEGKEKSKQNSRKHGFFARQTLPAGKDGDKLWQAYADLAAGLWEYFNPVGYLEGLLTEKVITESIRLSRLMEFESRYIGKGCTFYMSALDRILRFQSSINRQLFQAIKELERVQEKRKENPSNHLDRKPDGEDNGLAAPFTPDPEPFPEFPFCGASAIQAESEDSEASAPPVTNKGENPNGAQTQVSTASSVRSFCKRPTKSLADMLTKKAGLPPYEPPVANHETNPTLVVSEKSDALAPSSTFCGTNPTPPDKEKTEALAPTSKICGTNPSSSGSSAEEEDLVFQSLNW